MKAIHWKSISLLLAVVFRMISSVPSHALPSIWDDPAQALVAQNLNGSSIDIAKTPRWKVLYFWCTYCPCVRACEKYSFLPLAQKYKGQVSFYAIAADGWDLQLPRAELRQRFAEHHLPYPLLLDTTHAIATTLGARVTPEAFIIDPQGHVVFSGMADDSRRYLEHQATLTSGKLYVPKTYLSTALAEALAHQSITPSPVKDDGCIIAW